MDERACRTLGLCMEETAWVQVQSLVVCRGALRLVEAAPDNWDPGRAAWPLRCALTSVCQPLCLEFTGILLHLL